MNAEKFQSLINNPESSVLDFKSRMYDLDSNAISKLIKDVISFINTIRIETSYILIGISENKDGSKELLGLDQNFDDALLQDKVKDKVYPRPNFKYYQFEFESKNFGVLEFPIIKYPIPLSTSIKMKGLEAGQVYYRRGTTNSEAIGIEVIRINDWLNNLPETSNNFSPEMEISSFLKKFANNSESLSIIIAELLPFSKKIENKKLENFCQFELQGLRGEKSDFNPEDFNYRIQQIIMSPLKIELNPYSFVKATMTIVRNELKEHEKFYDYRLMFPEPILELENQIAANRENPDTVCSIVTTSSHRVFPNAKGKDIPVYVYIFRDNYENLYSNIRQKGIEILMEIE